MDKFFIAVFFASLLALLPFAANSERPPRPRIANNSFEVNVYVSQYSRIQHEAKKGYPDAQYRLAKFYYAPPRRSGFPKNKKRAFEFFTKAAVQGHKEAQFSVGVMYAQGDGVDTDKLRSLAWISLSADAGYKKAKKAYDILSAKSSEADLEKVQAIKEELQKSIFTTKNE